MVQREKKRTARKSLASRQWIWMLDSNSGRQSLTDASSVWVAEMSVPCAFVMNAPLKTINWWEPGRFHPANPTFHLARAIHMVGRCIDCGLCEEACPADIPLRTLYKKVTEIISKEFGYKTGFSVDEKSPFNIIEVK